MKTNAVLLVAALVVALSPTHVHAIAEDDPDTFGAEPAWSLTTEVGLHETYLAQYTGLIWYDGPVAQGSVTLAHGSGLYLNVWASTGMDNQEWSSNWDDEIDYTVGWAGPLGFLGLEADVSASYYDGFQVGASAFNDYYGVTAILSRPFEWRGWRLAPSVLTQLTWAAGNQNRDTTGVYLAEGGSTWGINLAASRDICRYCAFSGGTGVFFDGGSYGREDAVIWESSASLDWKIGERVTLSLPSLRVASPLSSVDRDTVWCWGASLSVSF